MYVQGCDLTNVNEFWLDLVDKSFRKKVREKKA